MTSDRAEFRVYLLVRDLRQQCAAYLGIATRARGDPPFAGQHALIAGQHALIVEAAPVLAIELAGRDPAGAVHPGQER